MLFIPSDLSEQKVRHYRVWSRMPRDPQLEATVLVDEVKYYATLIRPTAPLQPHSARSKFQNKRFGPKKASASKLSPSVQSFVRDLSKNKYGVPQKVDTVLPLEKQISTVMTACSQALAAAHGHSADGNAFVPISTVAHDDKQLVFGKKDGTTLCTAGSACQALRLKNAPGPLNGFLLEGQDPKEATFCLLCYRVHLQTLNCQLLAIDPKNKSGCLDAPFTNLQNVPGGYFCEAMGVKESVNRIFNRQCSIVGANANLEVQYCPSDGTWFVNQDILKWSGPSF